MVEGLELLADERSQFTHSPTRLLAYGINSALVSRRRHVLTPDCMPSLCMRLKRESHDWS